MPVAAFMPWISRAGFGDHENAVAAARFIRAASSEVKTMAPLAAPGETPTRWRSHRR
jgi:hypothetical protein